MKYFKKLVKEICVYNVIKKMKSFKYEVGMTKAEMVERIKELLEHRRVLVGTWRGNPKQV